MKYRRSVFVSESEDESEGQEGFACNRPKTKFSVSDFSIRLEELFDDASAAILDTQIVGVIVTVPPYFQCSGVLCHTTVQTRTGASYLENCSISTI